MTSVSRSMAASGHQVDHRLGAAGVRELEVGAVAERVVRARIDADPAQDAAALVDLVLLEDARLRHQRAGRARLRAAAARHARRVVEAHVERRRDERVEADPHEVVARGADDLGADVGAAAAVDAARRLAQDERVAVVADVVVVDAGEPVLGDAPVAGALVVFRLERLRGSSRTRCPGGAGRRTRSPRRCTGGSGSTRRPPPRACTGSRTRCSCRCARSASSGFSR